MRDKFILPAMATRPHRQHSGAAKWLFTTCLVALLLGLGTLFNHYPASPPVPRAQSVARLRRGEFQAGAVATRGREPYKSQPLITTRAIPGIPQSQIDKGNKYLCLMNAQSNEAAAAINGGKSIVSQWTNFDSLAAWGWEEQEESDNDYAMFLGDALADASLGINAGNIREFNYDHDKTEDANGMPIVNPGGVPMQVSCLPDLWS